MQSLLIDIELDIQELKYLVQLTSENPDQRLCEVTKRRASQLEERCRKLRELLDKGNVMPQEATVMRESPIELDDGQPENVSLLEKNEIKSETIVESESLVNQETFPEEIVVPLTETFSMTEAKPILGETIRKSIGLVGSLSLNDSFRYSQELFNGDIPWMNEILKRIEQEANSPEEAFRIIGEVSLIKEENETIADFREWIIDSFDR